MEWFHRKDHTQEEIDELRRIEHTDEHIEHDLDLLVDAELHYPRGVVIQQLSPSGEFQMAITGTPAGGTSVFQGVPTPAGSVYPVGTTFVWTVDDVADISFTPSADGTQVSCACSATPTGTSYNLTQTSSFTPPGASAPLSGTANVPILPGTGPTNTPTGITINQLS